MRRVITFAAALALVVAGFATGAVLATDDPNVIHGCVNNNTGRLSVVTTPGDCAKNEAPLDWNQQGPPGEPGSAGVSGWEFVVDEVAAVDTEIRATAFCPTDKRVLGGGATASTLFVLQESTPRFVEQGWFSDGWHAKIASKDGTAAEGRVFTYAICAAVN